MARMGSGENLFLPGRKSLVWFRFEMSLTVPVFAHMVPRGGLRSGKVWNLPEVEPGWRKWVTGGTS